MLGGGNAKEVDSNIVKLSPGAVVEVRGLQLFA